MAGVVSTTYSVSLGLAAQGGIVALTPCGAIIASNPIPKGGVLNQAPTEDQLQGSWARRVGKAVILGKKLQPVNMNEKISVCFWNTSLSSLPGLVSIEVVCEVPHVHAGCTQGIQTEAILSSYSTGFQELDKSSWVLTRSTNWSRDISGA